MRRRLQSIDLRHRYAARPSRLKAVDELSRHQRIFIQEIKQDPEASYVFAGENQKGKTHLAVSLFKHALSSNRYTWWGSTKRLFEEHSKAAISEYIPALTCHSLSRASSRWAVFLHEIEKGGRSDFKDQVLFEVLDAIWANGHQLVVTTNLRRVETRTGVVTRTVQERVEQHWGGRDSIYGPSIASRLGDCTWLEF